MCYAVMWQHAAYTVPHERNVVTARKRRVLIVLADAVQNVLELLILADFFLKKFIVFTLLDLPVNYFIFLTNSGEINFPTYL